MTTEPVAACCTHWAKLAREAIAEGNAHAGKALLKYWRAGDLLMAAKAEVGHGHWLDWLTAEGIDAQAAQRSMRLRRKYVTRDAFEAAIRSGATSLRKALAPSSAERVLARGRAAIERYGDSVDMVAVWEEEIEAGRMRDDGRLAAYRAEEQDPAYAELYAALGEVVSLPPDQQALVVALAEADPQVDPRRTWRQPDEQREAN